MPALNLKSVVGHSEWGTQSCLADCHPTLMDPDQHSAGGPREDPERVGARGKLLKLLPGSLFGEGSMGWDGSKKASEEEI